jgi:sulfoxide reductase heme-binding subunit YedZ
MKDPRFAKFVLFINALVPAGMLAWDVLRKNTTNPVEFSIRVTGILTIVFLLLSLTVTPLRLVSGWNWLSHFRRMLGLFAFFYGVVHLLIFVEFQTQGGADFIDEVLYRKFVFFGMAALLLMLPLAWTSTAGWVKKLGAAGW